ncbi:MAG: hypothetical protein U1D25_08335 [Hydrogenophaga sp.]|uniref:hypothetical protein n=1 Tax=Hydrogenophaga sp. TaxID=1904254 RepID=UPI0027795315|nr:hypothetical protein [Hydrogenophaga sp.]MDP2418504.1 hypothetical protein [Hydrogenophaga sp.]MDZ4188098.1 hypothetical protein [Hydrogenophaga sp.]
MDANVLYPQLIRDTLLSLTVERLYHSRWSATIHAEWTRNLAKDQPELAAGPTRRGQQKNSSQRLRNGACP